MAVKFTDAKKWDDVWFSQLTMEQKVMFMYLCDVCDIAGFYEVNCRLVSLRTGVEDVRGAVKSLSKSVLFKDNYVFIKNHIKHQRNLPLNLKNNAHKGIISSISDRIESFPEIFDILPEQDVLIIKERLGIIRGSLAPTEGLPSPTSKGSSNSIVTTDTPQEESKIARLYKYFVGEDNLIGQGITEPIRVILTSAMKIMDVDKWKPYCDARHADEYKASPKKFFLEDGWRRYGDEIKTIEQNNIRKDKAKEETDKRSKMPFVEPPDDFKKFVKGMKGKPIPPPN